jgi:hypothetical protein
MVGMKSEPSATLKALEASILETMRTLDSIHEHALPSETPDNKGLALNVHKLVKDLSQMRNASIQRQPGDVDIAVPLEVVEGFVDEGRSPDEYTAQQYGKAQHLSNDARGKQEALQKLATVIREASQDLLEGRDGRG